MKTVALNGRLTEGTRYFFLSIVGISVRSAFSQMTCDNGGNEDE